MKTKNAFKLVLPATLALLLSAAGPFAPSLSSQAAKGGVSRSMEQAIRLYHEGEDTEAMDRFMDILVKGSPSEKALANEYITKITLRMNTGVNTVTDRGAEPTTLTEVSQPKTAPSGRQDVPLGLRLKETRDAEDAELAARDDAESQRERVSEKIAAKIAQMRRDILLELGRADAVKVYMGGDGLPRAITLDANYFFASTPNTETTFRPGTDKMLGLLSGLLFTLGKGNALLLPEGSAEGDVKIKSIRRAIALNSYFESRGISKSRLEVNLTGTDIRFPKELTNISGLIILFDYDKQPRLKELEDLQTRGPKVSLGIYPTAIAVHNNEGAIVEFSAFESPIGQPSWKFQIFEVQKDGSRLMLQEMSGSGPQFNQSFWNGRKKFFGASYPTGKYMFTVTATDVEGRETSLSRLLAVRPTPEEEAAMRARPAPKPVEKVTSSGVKTRSLSSKGVKGGVSGKTLKGPGRKGKALKKAPPKKKAAPKKKALPADDGAGAEGSETSSAGDAPAAGDSAPPGELSGQFSYKVFFTEANALTSSSEKRLAQVAETMGYYPMANIQLTGYAYSGEPNADTLAENRVNTVAARLADKYKIDKARMEMSSKVSEATKAMVEIKLAGKE
jgi:outer membrane protein OmpA-like peptidoglycan-associated protein